MIREHQPAFEGAIGGTVSSLLILSAWWAFTPKTPEHATYLIEVPGSVSVSVQGHLNAATEHAKASGGGPSAEETKTFREAIAEGMPMDRRDPSSFPTFDDGTRPETIADVLDLWYLDCPSGQFCLWIEQMGGGPYRYCIDGFDRVKRRRFEPLVVSHAVAFDGDAYRIEGDFAATARP